jgi:glucose-1-phosphatase
MKTVIFDLGGVVLEDGAYSVWPKLEWLSGQQVAEAEHIFRDHRRKDSLADLELGKISARQFLRSYYKLVDLGVETTKFESLLLASFTPNYEIWDLIKELHRQAKMILLTNHNEAWMEKWLHKYEIFSFFEKIFVSAHLKLRKPGQGIFNYALRHSDSKPGETFMIDDQPENLLTAKALGLKTFLYHGPQNIERLRRELNEFLKI